MRRLSLGTFVVGVSVAAFFFAFNCFIPFLRAPAEAGANANQALDRFSSFGAMAYPIAVVLMGFGYFGIVLSPRDRQSTSRRSRGTATTPPTQPTDSEPYDT